MDEKYKEKIDKLELSFVEFRAEIKRDVGYIKDKIDELFADWQKFGGLYTQTKLDSKRVNDLEEKLDDEKKKNVKLEKRVDSLEKWKIKIIAVAFGIFIAGKAILYVFENTVLK